MIALYALIVCLVTGVLYLLIGNPPPNNPPSSPLQAKVGELCRVMFGYSFLVFIWHVGLSTFHAFGK